jgi:hypothetical protein
LEGQANGQATSMLDRLVTTYGPDAVLTVVPNLLEDGELVGWIVEVDGESIGDLETTVTDDGDTHVLFVVERGEAVELARWPSNDERVAYRETLEKLRRS